MMPPDDGYYDYTSPLGKNSRISQNRVQKCQFHPVDVVIVQFRVKHLILCLFELFFICYMLSKLFLNDSEADQRLKYTREQLLALQVSPSSVSSKEVIFKNIHNFFSFFFPSVSVCLLGPPPYRFKHLDRRQND